MHTIDAIFYTFTGYYCIQKLGYFGDDELIQNERDENFYYYLVLSACVGKLLVSPVVAFSNLESKIL